MRYLGWYGGRCFIVFLIRKGAVYILFLLLVLGDAILKEKI